MPRLRVRLAGQKERRALPVGARVDAAFGGDRTRLFGARVTRVADAGAGTHDLAYEDGDVEVCAAATIESAAGCMRACGGTNRTRTRAAQSAAGVAELRAGAAESWRCEEREGCVGDGL